MAVRDAEAGHRAAPLWVKGLVAAGFAVAAWLAAGLLGSLTASADEAPLGDQHTPAETTHHQKSPQQGGLLGGLVDTTLTTLVSTVEQTVNTTLGTVTNTVDTLTTTVTETTNTVLQPVTATLAPPAPKQQEPTESATTGQTRIETAAPEPEPVVPPAPQPAPAEPATVTVVPQQTVKDKPQPAAAPYQPATVSAPIAQPKHRHPAPLPSAPGGQSCSAVAAHDSGGNTKHPLAILGARSGAAQLASIGVPRRHAQVDNSRDAALPTTSPD